MELSRIFQKVSNAIHVDFKMLMHSGSPLAELRNHLKEENVADVAKVASKIPSSEPLNFNGFLTSSLVRLMSL